MRAIRLWSVCPLTNLLWFLYQTVECGSSILSEWFFISRVLSLPWPTVTGLHRRLDRLCPALLSHWTDCTWLCYDLLYWDERPAVVWWPVTCRIVLSPMVSHITFIIVLSLKPNVVWYFVPCAVCCLLWQTVSQYTVLYCDVSDGVLSLILLHAREKPESVLREDYLLRKSHFDEKMLKLFENGRIQKINHVVWRKFAFLIACCMGTKMGINRWENLIGHWSVLVSKTVITTVRNVLLTFW